MHADARARPTRLRRLEAPLILTLDGADGRVASANSLDFYDGRIVAIDAPRPAGLPEDAILDLGAVPGATVIPGLIDAHLHLLMGGISLGQLDLAAVSSRESFADAVAAHAATLDDDEWLVGWGWSEENWPGHATPDRSWLAAVGDRPALCWRMDHHACVVNDTVLASIRERFGELSDPPGGRYVRDGGGAPTGLLLEAAAWQHAIPLVPAPNVARRHAALRAGMALLNRNGIVACGAMEYAKDLREAFAPLRNELSVRIRATVLDRDWPLDLSLADAIDCDAMLAIIGFKAFADGTLGSRTAAMLEPYADDPTNSGTLVELTERGELEPWMRAVAARGLSPSVHAIGDRALRIALDAAEAAGVGPSLRLEHVQTVHRDDLPRLRGRWASMQPQHRADDGRFAERRLGTARMEEFFPFRRLIDHGARLAFGSDWPIVPPDPIAGIRAAVTTEDLDGRVVEPSQRLMPLEALHAYTRGAAECLGIAGGGRIGVGANADLTVLSADPLAADWRNAPPRPICTIVDGRLMWHEAAWREASASDLA